MSMSTTCDIRGRRRSPMFMSTRDVTSGLSFDHRVFDLLPAANLLTSDGHLDGFLPRVCHLTVLLRLDGDAGQQLAAVGELLWRGNSSGGMRGLGGATVGLGGATIGFRGHQPVGWMLR